MNASFRFILLIPFVAIVVLIGITWWLLQVALPKKNEAAPYPKTYTLDYFVDNFSMSALDQSGRTQYRFTAARLVHVYYQNTEKNYLINPTIRAFRPGKPVVTATAQRGTVNSDASIINMYDQACITRASSIDGQLMHANSEHFRVLVNDNVILTKKPVKLSRGQSVITATHGMHYNNATRVIQLFGNIRGSIAPGDAR